MSRTHMKPVGQEEELTCVFKYENSEEADKMRETLLKLADAFAAAEKTTFRHLVKSSPAGMALMLAEVSARPDAPKTYREWRKWLLEEYRCDT